MIRIYKLIYMFIHLTKRNFRGNQETSEKISYSLLKYFSNALYIIKKFPKFILQDYLGKYLKCKIVYVKHFKHFIYFWKLLILIFGICVSGNLVRD